jgi:LmbE family N-acetylglucosaminyl deacetylase
VHLIPRSVRDRQRKICAIATLIAFVVISQTSFRSSANVAIHPRSSTSLESAFEERGVLALDQALRDLSNPYTVACMALEPGYEDQGTLAYYRRKYGSRTIIIYATRGEGEESASGGELGAELAAIKTREALNSARMIGADVAFLNLRDSGYSKSSDDALTRWGHDEALRRLVRAIRSLRPDVIFGSYQSGSGDGRLQALARLTREAFDAAANPKRLPEAGSESWQTRRLFQTSNEATATVRMNLREYDPLRGRTYAELALEARRQYSSLGTPPDSPSYQDERRFYKLIASSESSANSSDSGSSANDESRLLKSLIDDLKLPTNLLKSVEPPILPGVRLLDAETQPAQLIDPLREKLIERRAEGGVDALRERHGPEFHRVLRYTRTVERTLALALGLRFEISVSDPVVVRGQRLSLNLVFQNRSGLSLPVRFNTPDQAGFANRSASFRQSEIAATLPDETLSRSIDYEVPKDAGLTLPRSAHLYDDEYYGPGESLPGSQPEDAFGNQIIAIAEVGLTDVTFQMTALARYDIASAVEIETVPFVLVKDWDTPRDIEFPVRLHNRTAGPLSGGLWIVPLAMQDEKYEPARVSFGREDEEITCTLRIRAPVSKPPVSTDILIEFRRDGASPSEALGSIRVPVKVASFDAREGSRIGYLRGFDSWLSLALMELGVSATELRIADVRGIRHGAQARGSADSLPDPAPNPGAPAEPDCFDLSRFDAIVIDYRAYVAHPELLSCNRCLLRFVQDGGNLIVLGQESSDWNLLLTKPAFAPYGIRHSKERVSLESAAVSILDAGQALLLKPNGITARDFDGWSGERARFLPSAWAPEFTPLLETGDPGDPPQRGGLLIARYGEGTFVYTTMSWRRQLLAGHGGAYRVFANLISQPRSSKQSATSK